MNAKAKQNNRKKYARKLNAKGSMTTEIVIWAAVLVTVLIALLWLLQNFSYERPVFEKLENDAGRLGAMINNSCESFSYKRSFNPQTEDGNIVANSKEICVSSGSFKRCRTVFCKVQGNTINLENIIYVWVEKNDEGTVRVYGE